MIENTIVIVDPTSADSTDNDYAIRVDKENVVIRNVVVYHAANGFGIYGMGPNNLTIENVQVVAYGNEWGAQPCPSRKPFNGADCSNIKIYNASPLNIHNVQLENGSRGISLSGCPGAQLTSIVAKNVRGPFPAGQCV